MTLSRQNWNPPDLDYEPASTEFNVAQSRTMLARLCNIEADLFSPLGTGACEDCGTLGELHRYGARRICHRDALRRNRAGRKAQER